MYVCSGGGCAKACSALSCRGFSRAILCPASTRQECSGRALRVRRRTSSQSNDSLTEPHVEMELRAGRSFAEWIESKLRLRGIASSSLNEGKGRGARRCARHHATVGCATLSDQLIVRRWILGRVETVCGRPVYNRYTNEFGEWLETCECLFTSYCRRSPSAARLVSCTNTSASTTVAPGNVIAD
eukprot:scaffold15475_cov31-Tisochrysis_lutea.AAC.5